MNEVVSMRYTKRHRTKIQLLLKRRHALNASGRVDLLRWRLDDSASCKSLFEFVLGLCLNLPDSFPADPHNFPNLFEGEDRAPV